MSQINAKNAGYFSSLAYEGIGTTNEDGDLDIPADAGLSDWVELTDIPLSNGKSLNIQQAIEQIPGNDPTTNGAYTDQFRVFTNNSNQIVIAFKGSTEFYNFENDILNDGYADYSRLEAVTQQVIAALQAAYPTYQIITDGHSLGGGLAQTFALKDGLSGFGQNALPVSSEAIKTDLKQYIGQSNSQIQSEYASTGHQFVETYTDGDIATLYYSTIKNGLYLDPTPTKLPSPFSSNAAKNFGVRSFIAT